MPTFDEDGKMVDCCGMMMFFRNDAGEFVPLTSVQTAQLTNGECTYSNDLWSAGYEPFEFSMTGRMTHKSARRLRKQLLADIRRISRVKRNMKRRKEKARRERLKGIRNEQETL